MSLQLSSLLKQHCFAMITLSYLIFSFLIFVSLWRTIFSFQQLFLPWAGASSRLLVRYWSPWAWYYWYWLKKITKIDSLFLLIPFRLREMSRASSQSSSLYGLSPYESMKLVLEPHPSLIWGGGNSTFPASYLSAFWSNALFRTSSEVDVPSHTLRRKGRFF